MLVSRMQRTSGIGPVSDTLNIPPVIAGLDQPHAEGSFVTQLSMMRVVRRHGGAIMAETTNLVLAMALFEIDRVTARRLCERLEISPEATVLPLGVMDQVEGLSNDRANAA